MANIVRSDPFEDLFRGFFVRPVDFGNGGMENPSLRVDLRERPDAYVVHAELPGTKKEDIEVRVEGRLLTISAERKMERELKEGERVLRTERSFGRVSRSFELASDLDETGAQAKFTDGVLELTLPKKAGSQPHRLSIQ